MRSTLFGKTLKLPRRIRAMSTKRQFLVQVFDFPGTIQKRIDVRQAHLAAVGENQAVKAGGNYIHLCAIGNANNRCILLKRSHSRGSNAIRGKTPLECADDVRGVYSSWRLILRRTLERR